MTLNDLHRIALKIDYGVADQETRNPRFQQLWAHPFVCEKFIAMIEAIQQDDLIEECRRDFENSCALLCPEFISILVLLFQP